MFRGRHDGAELPGVAGGGMPGGGEAGTRLTVAMKTTPKDPFPTTLSEVNVRQIRCCPVPAHE